MASLAPWQLLAAGLLIFLFQSVLVQNQVVNNCLHVECGHHASCENDSCSCEPLFWRERDKKKMFKNKSENDCMPCNSYVKVDEKSGCMPGYSTCPTDFQKCCVNACPEQCGKHASCQLDCGNYFCQCKLGFQLPNGRREFKNRSENNCQDIDECSENRCDKTARCSNYEGSYSCYCPSGYFQYSDAAQEDKRKIKCKEFSRSMPSQNSCSDGQSLFCNITTQLGHIFSSPPNVSNQMDSEKQLRKTLDTLDNLVNLMKDENKEEKKEVATGMMELTEAWLRIFASALPSGSTTIKAKGTELAMEIRTAKNASQGLAQLLLNEIQMELMWEAASKKEEALSVVGLLSYQNLGSVLTGAPVVGTDWEQIGKSKQLMQETGKPNYKVLSKVASAFVGHNETTDLSNPVTITFNHPKPESKPDVKVICAFWKPADKSGHWSQEGCERLNTSTANRTYCRCNHLTSFAVLMAFYDVEDWTLSVITKVGLIISLICLFFSILTFLFCRAIQGIRTTIHLHLCLALFVAHVIFLGTGASSNTMACAVVAGLLHYFFLCVFCWMLLEGVQLYLMVVQVFNTHSLKHWHLFLMGYGLPAVLVGISAATNSKGYGSKNCWLSRERGFLWSFLAPVCIIIMVNVVVFIITVWKLSEKFADITPDLTKYKKQRVFLITAIAQLCILGLTWILGLFQFSEQTLILSYLFTIFNSLQGLFIFLLHCLLKKQVRDDYYRWLCQSRRGKTRSNDKYSEFSSTAGSNTFRSPKTLKESGM